MSAERDILPLALPLAVSQALDDTALPPAARLTMWHLRTRLDAFEFREVYRLSLASEMRMKETTVGQMLKLLVSLGYLDESEKRKPTAYRMPYSRRVTRARAA